MSLIDKINSCVIARIEKKQALINISIEGDTVVGMMNGQRKTLRLADLAHAILYYHTNYVGSDIVLLLNFSDGSNCQMAQNNSQWFDLMAALDRSGKIAVPSYKWQIDFLALGDNVKSLDLISLR
jgi:hypothetical protein